MTPGRPTIRAITIAAGGVCVALSGCAGGGSATTAPRPIASTPAPEPVVEPAPEAVSAEQAQVNAFLDGLETELSGMDYGELAGGAGEESWVEAARDMRAAEAVGESSSDPGGVDDDAQEDTDASQADANADTGDDAWDGGGDDPGDPDDASERGASGVGVDGAAPGGPAAPLGYDGALDALARLTLERAYEPETAETGFTTRVRLAMIRALGWDGETGATDTLTATEAESMSSIDDAATKLRSVLDGGAALPDDVRAALAEVTGGADEPAVDVDTLRAPVLALCTRVTGFGVYEEFETDSGVYRFGVGRRHRVIIYTELDGVEMRAAATTGANASMGPGISGYASELTQRVELFFDGTDRLEPSGDVLVWSSVDAGINDFSRSPRRDFFTTQMIDLPRTLSVGRYRLRLTVEDGVGGGVAEAVAVIEIVAR